MKKSVSSRFCGMMLSTPFQAALQLASGILVVCLFTFAQPMSFPHACISAALYYVVAVLCCPDTHVGTRILAAACFMGSTLGTLVYGGALLSLAKIWTDTPAKPGINYVVACCIISSAGLIPLVVARVSVYPPYLWGMGMTSCLQYGVFFICGYLTYDTGYMWQQVIGYQMLEAAVAAGFAALAAIIVLPTFSADEARQKTSLVMRGVGHHISRYTSRLFVAPSIVEAVLQSENISIQESYLSTLANWQPTPPAIPQQLLIEDNELDAESWRHVLHLASTPSTDTDKQSDGKAMLPPPPPVPTFIEGAVVYRGGIGGPGVGSLRPVLDRARDCLTTSRYEPRWLNWGSPGIDFEPWSHLMDCLGSVLGATAALELVLEEGISMRDLPHAADFTDLVKTVYAEAASALAMFSVQLSQRHKHYEASLDLDMWERSRQRVKAAVTKFFQKVSRNTRASADEKQRIDLISASEMRCFSTISTIALGLSEAMSKLHKALLVVQRQGPPRIPLSSSPVLHTPASGGVATATATVTTTSSTTNGDSSTTGSAKSPFETAFVPSAALEPAKGLYPELPPRPSFWKRNFEWLWLLLPIVVGWPLLVNLWRAVTRVFLPACASWVDFVAYVRDRDVQAAFKYWLVLSIVFVIELPLLMYSAKARQVFPVYGYIAASLAFSQRVEGTISALFTWWVANVLGGLIGYLAMLNSNLASNPYALTALMVGMTFLAGCFFTTQFKFVITLGLMELSALILCQYRGCDSHDCRVDFFTERTLAVIGATLIALSVCNLILPWYMNQHCLTIMCQTLKGAVTLLQAQYTTYVNDYRAAAAGPRAMPPAAAAVLVEAAGKALATPRRAASLAQQASLGRGSTPTTTTTTASMGTVADVSEQKNKGNTGPGSESLMPAGSELSAPLNLEVSMDTKRAASLLRKATKASTEAATAAAPSKPVLGPSDKGVVVMVDAVDAPAPPTSQVPSHPDLIHNLVGVQIILMFDQVLWKRGIMSTPRVVYRMLDSLLPLLSTLGVLASILREPPLSGYYTGSNFHMFTQPLDNDYRRLVAMLESLLLAINRQVQEFSEDSRHQLKGCIEDLVQERLRSRARYLAVRRDYYRIMAAVKDDEVDLYWHPDDSVRFLSVTYAVLRALDRFTMVARTLLLDECQVTSSWSWWVK